MVLITHTVRCWGQLQGVIHLFSKVRHHFHEWLQNPSSAAVLQITMVMLNWKVVTCFKKKQQKNRFPEKKFVLIYGLCV